MSDAEYVPTTEDIIRYFVAPPYKVERQREGEGFAEYLNRTSIETMHSRQMSEDAARRWLAAHDREVAEKAWERAEFAFERAHNADMLEPWGHMPDNPYRGTPEQEGKGDD